MADWQLIERTGIDGTVHVWLDEPDLTESAAPGWNSLVLGSGENATDAWQDALDELWAHVGAANAKVMFLRGISWEEEGDAQ
jgi:hypothetical protein